MSGTKVGVCPERVSWQYVKKAGLYGLLFCVCLMKKEIIA